MGVSLQLCTPVGSVPSQTNYYINMNKFLAVFCLAAAANAAPKADADPYLLYGGYNGLGYAGYGGLYGGYLGAYHAAPVVAAGIASVSPSASVNIAGLALPATPAIAGGYAAAGRYVANSAGVVHVAKREAEDEADAEADPYLLYSGLGHLGYAGYGYAGVPYAGYTGLGYNYGLGYAHYAGQASVSPSGSVNIAGLAPAVVGGYAAAGRYCANSAGVVHCA